MKSDGILKMDVNTKPDVLEYSYCVMCSIDQVFYLPLSFFGIETYRFSFVHLDRVVFLCIFYTCTDFELTYSLINSVLHFVLQNILVALQRKLLIVL